MHGLAQEKENRFFLKGGRKKENDFKWKREKGIYMRGKHLAAVVSAKCGKDLGNYYRSTISGFFQRIFFQE